AHTARVRGRVGHRHLHQGEVHRAVVVQDQEPVLAADHGVFHGVLHPVAARPDHGELGVRVGGVGVAHLGGDGAAGDDHHVLVAAGAADAQPEPFVGFVVHELGVVAGSQAVPPDAVRAPGGVDGGVVDRAVVGGPGGSGGDPGDGVVVHLAGPQ